MPFCSPAELEARLRLHTLPDIGPRRFHLLIQAFGSASAAFSAPASAWSALGIPASSAEARRTAQTRERAAHALAWLDKPGHQVVSWDDPCYPALLAETKGAPPLLYVEGNLDNLERPQLALVGSRQASTAGLDNAHHFARSLAAAGFCITSGLALGVDGAAHHGALEACGSTIAVLGTGLEQLYPRRHLSLAKRIVENDGTLVSELPLDAAPNAANFPRRNRIISGLSLGVLVIEASPSSGSLITARLAAEQGREVFAIPGSIHHPGARGCHQLIRDGATLVESIEHILEALRGWQMPVTNASSSVDVPRETHPLLLLLQAEPCSSERLAATSGMDIAELLAMLTDLELDGRVAREHGVWVYRAP
ncbi:DNA processing protein [Pseudomonas duriflava]|uniref:DNA processing protein n=1 Tax=Pseudomonas duriflava TaxID=459528 RepID=A0A562QNL5_9PSED|nr:DNA-processing protein DprA [Pseudomonas duriflava]TWI57656.1 DNA processing protein [Pseudomonas duriflava]